MHASEDEISRSIDERYLKLRKVWTYQRTMLWLFLVLVVSSVLFVLIGFGPTVLTGVLFYGSYIVLVIVAGILMGALGLRRAEIIAFLILFLLPPFPVCQLIVIWFLNHRSNDLIKTAGGRVGFFGASRGAIDHLQPGLCTQCGYNLEQLSEARCPECGEPFDPKARDVMLVGTLD